MKHAGGRFVVSDAPQRSRRQPSRNRPPALPTARPRASDLRGQQVDGKARGGDTGARQCPQTHDVDLRFRCLRHRVSSAPLGASPRRPRRGLLDRRKGCACLAQRAASSSRGHSVPPRVRAMHVATEQKDRSRNCDISRLTNRLCVRVRNMPHPSDKGFGPEPPSFPGTRKSQTAGAVWPLA
jgi:hypothetical protein